MRLYQKGDRLYFMHKASMVCEFLGAHSGSLIAYRKLPDGCKREDFHRVSIEVVNTKKEMAAKDARMRKATRRFKKLLASKVAIGLPSRRVVRKKGGK